MPDDSTGGFHMSDDNDSQGYTEGPPDDAPATDAPAERERTAREVLGTLDKDSPGVVAALWWALDMLDMYDRELLRRGDPPEKVNSATHLEAKAKSRRALNAAVAALSVPVEP